jgi:hypothetical protein
MASAPRRRGRQSAARTSSATPSSASYSTSSHIRGELQSEPVFGTRDSELRVTANCVEVAFAAVDSSRRVRNPARRPA